MWRLENENRKMVVGLSYLEMESVRCEGDDTGDDLTATCQRRPRAMQGRV